MTSSIRIHSFPLSGHAHRVQLFASIAGIAHETVHVDLAAGERQWSRMCACWTCSSPTFKL